MPLLSVAQMIRVDALMEKKFGIRLIQMMENAGRSVAELATHRFLEGNAKFKQVVVMVGSGNNGGGALVAARHLHNAGAKVSVLLSRPANYLSDITMLQLKVLQNMEIEIKEAKILVCLPSVMIWS